MKGTCFWTTYEWREPQNHISDCYFCIAETKGFNAKNKADIVPKFKISQKTSAALSNIPAPDFKNLPDLYMVDNDDDDAPMGESTRNFDYKDGDYVVEAEPPKNSSRNQN